MEPYVFKFKNHLFAVGLFWQPLSEDSRNVRSAEIKALAEEMSFDLHVLRRTPTACVGFASTGGKIKPGVLAAAAIVSKGFEFKSDNQNFILAIKLPDDYWMYLVQRDGIIMPDGDRWFSSEKAIRARFLEELSLGEWAKVYAPASWGVPDSQEAQLEDFLPENRRGQLQVYNWWKLIPVNQSKIVYKNYLKIAVGLVALYAAFMGWKYVERVWQEQALRAAQQAALQAQQVTQSLVLPHPWRLMPSARAMMQSCLHALDGINLFPGNWEMSLINCSEKNLIVSWVARPGGWVDHLKSVLPQADVSLDGTLATMTVPLAGIEAGGDEAVLTMDARAMHLRSVAQRFGAKLTLQPVAQTIMPMMPGQEGGVIPMPDWRELKFEISDVLLPQSLIDSIDGPGVRLTGIKAAWNNGALIWKIEGVQYVRT